MIATKLAVLMAAMIIGVVGISAAALPAVEAGPINTSRSNLKSLNIAQQEGEVGCINQAEGQGDKLAVANTDQFAAADEGDPIPDIGVAQSEAGEFSQRDPQFTVDAEQSNECGVEQNQAVEQDADTVDFSTNEWTE